MLFRLFVWPQAFILFLSFMTRSGLLALIFLSVSICVSHKNVTLVRGFVSLLIYFNYIMLTDVPMQVVSNSIMPFKVFLFANIGQAETKWCMVSSSFPNSPKLWVTRCSHFEIFRRCSMILTCYNEYFGLTFQLSYLQTFPLVFVCYMLFFRLFTYLSMESLSSTPILWFFIKRFLFCFYFSYSFCFCLCCVPEFSYFCLTQDLILFYYFRLSFFMLKGNERFRKLISCCLSYHFSHKPACFQ